MEKYKVIEHLKSVLEAVEKIAFNEKEDIRVYVHINKNISESDIEISRK